MHGHHDRFISRLSKKALPLYWLLKKSEKFVWTPEGKLALDDLKRLLSTSQVLVAPMDNEPMLLYISTTTQVVSVVLVVECEEEGRVQKITYGIFMAAQKLAHYFQAHSFTMVSHTPLFDIIGNRDATG